MLKGLDIRELTIPLVQTASYPARPGNALRPLVDGEPAFRRVCEAIEAARHSVWATVTFMWADFQMPNGRGSAWEVLNRALATSQPSPRNNPRTPARSHLGPQPCS